MAGKPSINTGFVSNYVSVFCRRYFLNKPCVCIYCSQLRDYYLCLKDLETPCKESFWTFKGLCKHFETQHKFYTPYRRHPYKASQQSNKFYRRVPYTKEKQIFYNEQ